MQAPLRCAALQIEHRFGDVDAGLRQADELLSQAGPLDLALLPEACLTGYVSPAGSFDLSPLAEPPDGPTLARLADLARRHRLALAAPLIERDAGRFYNTFIILDPRGQLLARYRKRHPWLPETWATPGALPYPRVELAGRLLTLAICYDVHFLLRGEASDLLDEADVLLFPTAWVNGERRSDLRSHIIPALASRHRVAVVNANWARGRPAVPGQGTSMIVGPEGLPLASADGASPCAVVADL